MFTSIFRRIFEEARSKRVWSISSTFEYDLSPSISLVLSLLSHSRFFRYLLLWQRQRNNPSSFGSLCTGCEKSREASNERNESSQGQQTDERREWEKQKYIYIYIYTYRKREGRGMKSFEKCWVKWEALDECADNVELERSERHLSTDAMLFSLDLSNAEDSCWTNSILWIDGLIWEKERERERERERLLFRFVSSLDLVECD